MAIGCMEVDCCLSMVIGCVGSYYFDFVVVVAVVVASLVN